MKNCTVKAKEMNAGDGAVAGLHSEGGGGRDGGGGRGEDATREERRTEWLEGLYIIIQLLSSPSGSVRRKRDGSQPML